MSATKRTQLGEQAYALLSLLCEAYPRCFKHSNEPPVPLAIGMFDVVRDAVGDTVSIEAIKLGLALYCRRREYREALSRPGAVRVDLRGFSTGKVMPEHRQEAKGKCNAKLNTRKAAI